MTEIHKIPVGMLQTNCYLVADEKRGECVVIDPGDEADKIIDVITKNDLKPKVIILTHDHFDHVGALDEIKKFTACDVIDTQDADTIEIGDNTLKIIKTPGHTKDGICIVHEESRSIFTGDTLFKNSIGRTDLGGGDHNQIQKSLKLIMQFSDNYKIYPGHGPDSTIEEERKNNPFL